MKTNPVMMKSLLPAPKKGFRTPKKGISKPTSKVKDS
jgi:hypothetical protein